MEIKEKGKYTTRYPKQMHNDGYINVVYRSCTVKMYRMILFWYIVVLIQVIKAVQVVHCCVRLIILAW